VAAYSTGNVLPGGSISLSGAGAVIALPGSIFDIAGASGTVQVPLGTGLTAPHLATFSDVEQWRHPDVVDHRERRHEFIAQPILPARSRRPAARLRPRAVRSTSAW